MEKRKQIRRLGRGSGDGAAGLGGDRVNVTEEVTFEQRPEGGERVSHEGIWGKSILGRGPASAKALRHAIIQCFSGTARRPVWL